MEVIVNQERQWERSVSRMKNDVFTGQVRTISQALVRPVGAGKSPFINFIAGILHGIKVDSAPAGSSKKGYTTNVYLRQKSVDDTRMIPDSLREETSSVEVFSGYVLNAKPEAFAVRTNVSYDGTGDENSPAPGHTVTFQVKDFLYIKEERIISLDFGRPVRAGISSFIYSIAGIENGSKVDSAPAGPSKKGYTTNLGSCMKEICIRSECSTDDVSFVSENGGLEEFLIKAWRKSNMQLWDMYHGDLVVTMKKGERPETENFINYSSKPERHSGSSQDDDAIFPENDRLLCKVCYMNELNIVFLPCSHMVACRRCAARLKTCPVCRSGIKEALPANLHE